MRLGTERHKTSVMITHTAHTEVDSLNVRHWTCFLAGIYKLQTLQAEQELCHVLTWVGSRITLGEIVASLQLGLLEGRPSWVRMSMPSSFSIVALDQLAASSKAHQAWGVSCWSFACALSGFALRQARQHRRCFALRVVTARLGCGC